MLLTTILSVIREAFSPENSEPQSENKTKVDVNNRINLQNLEHIAGGDNQFTRQMLITFLETTTKGLQEINDAAASGQWNMVAELAHKMLPPSRHIGASDLSIFLRKIEDGIKNNEETTTITDLTKETVREFELIRDLVNEQIAKIS
jgi:HPt (histidine-containing phosphotransfer) domain-containing protein